MDINFLRERENNAPFSVTELNLYIKSLLENSRTLCAVTVRGEISNFTAHRSGHLYFSLKDAEGQIRAVMFRSSAARLKFMLESGMKVIVHGSVSVYARDGSYQIYVSSVQPDGVGALYLAYEQLKARLCDEGLFSDEHKLPLPRIPSKIGVITSSTGAAVRDIINVTGRRFPLADVYIYPALVQGDDAEEDLIRGVDYFDKCGFVDVIIIGRGGGSIEDLWAFNSERLARRIYDAEVPIVSAVGHETDFTICDFVADMRAPTPSAAAELVVPDMKDLILRIEDYYERISGALLRRVEYARERLARTIDSRALTDPDMIFEKKRVELSDYYSTVKSVIEESLKEHRTYITLCAEKTNAMNPLTVLSRGYSIAEQDGKALTSVCEVNEGSEISLMLTDGKIKGIVTEIQKKV